MDAKSAMEDKREVTCAKIIECAIEVHRHLGPGLLESAYEKCLAYELVQSGARVEFQKEVPILYKGLKIKSGFRADLIIDDLVLVELKSVEALTDVHTAQVLTCLKLTEMPLGLLLNFNVRLLKHGLKRVVHNLQPQPLRP